MLKWKPCFVNLLLYIVLDFDRFVFNMRFPFLKLLFLWQKGISLICYDDFFVIQLTYGKIGKIGKRKNHKFLFSIKSIEHRNCLFYDIWIGKWFLLLIVFHKRFSFCNFLLFFWVIKIRNKKTWMTGYKKYKLHHFLQLILMRKIGRGYARIKPMNLSHYILKYLTEVPDDKRIT